MAGIYIHIPFCKQACHYCNFHFATSLRQKNELVDALLKEVDIRQNYLNDRDIETIYLGGGTPSLLTHDDLKRIINRISSVFLVQPDAEITLEANPDDINETSVKEWKETGINRLSIGIQSFFDADLKWMNRAHTARQAMDGLELAKKHFENISIDLIYGIPGLSPDRWKQNVDQAIASRVQHLSCYALTVEPKTPLQKMISNRIVEDVDPTEQASHFLSLMQWLEDAGYEHYEISNFALPGFRSRHNSSYWSAATNGQVKKYIGIGPAAHSYDGNSRQWNVSNNQQYIQALLDGTVPFEKEDLTSSQKFNEYIMTSLRTSEGLNLDKLEKEKSDQLIKKAVNYTDRGLMIKKENFLVLTKEGKLLADGIASELFD